MTGPVQVMSLRPSSQTASSVAKASVHKAVTFIHRTLEYTESLGLPTNYGLAFEEFLTELK